MKTWCWSTNPKVSGAWFLRPADSRGWTKLRFGAGTGIKPPTAFELAFTNNPGLKPERSRSFDVGVEQALVGSALVADLTWFANRYDDLIVSVGSSFSGASRYQTDNIANASAKGLEFGASCALADGLSARVAWTFLDTEVLAWTTACPSRSGAVPASAIRYPPAAQPDRRGSDLVGRPHEAFFVVNGRGEMSDIEPNFAVHAYTNPGLRGRRNRRFVRVARGIEAFARVTNLFDKVYEEALGYPALGRAAMIGSVLLQPLISASGTATPVGPRGTARPSSTGCRWGRREGELVGILGPNGSGKTHAAAAGRRERP